MAMFHVGQKVVCINDSENFSRGLGAARHHGLRNGEIYTITGFTSLRNLELAGICGGWAPERFRPIVERKTDISIFHEILKKVGGRIDA